MSDSNEQLRLFTHASKRCSLCGEVKPLTEFHRERNARDGLQGRCKPCNIDGAKRFHADNLEHCRQRIRTWIRRVDDGNKRRVLEYLLTHPCVDCGEVDPVVLDFDHRRDKRFTIAELVHFHVRWRVVEAEIAKCDVRCSNCHRRRHAEEAGWFRAVAMRELTAGPGGGR